MNYSSIMGLGIGQYHGQLQMVKNLVEVNGSKIGGIVCGQDSNTHIQLQFSWREKLPLTHLLLVFQNVFHIVVYTGSMQFVTPTYLNKLL